jgi:hypothetical protein
MADVLISIVIIILFIIIVYSGATKKSLKEIFEEIKDLISGIGPKEKVEETTGVFG